MRNANLSPTPANIRAKRIEAGLTQTELGLLLYTTYRTVYQWEAGLRKMHPAFWELLAIKLAKHA